MNEFVKIIKTHIDAAIKLKRDFFDIHLNEIVTVAHILITSLKNKGKLLIFGNGGSAADAQHMAAEMVNRFRMERRPLPAIALTTDSSILTSIANDYSFEEVFSKQIDAIGDKHDVAIGITTSGNSKNVILAFKKAREKSIKTILIGGSGGGEAIKLADFALIVPSSEVAIIQEIHITIIHVLCDLVERDIFEIK